MADLEQAITALWEGGDDLASVMTEAEALHAVHEAIELLDRGDARRGVNAVRDTADGRPHLRPRAH